MFKQREKLILVLIAAVLCVLGLYVVREMAVFMMNDPASVVNPER